MDTQELLARTQIAANEALERGFVNTAMALNQIVESLLEIASFDTQQNRKKRSDIRSELQQLH